MNAGVKLIFLDVDGVLHSGTSGTCVRLPDFEAFLRAHPELRVVWSSTWRLDYSFDYLLSMVEPDVRGQFIGVTPFLPEATRNVREAEIAFWLSVNNASRFPWVALDDDAALFSPHCANLVLCQSVRGLRTAQLDQICLKLGLTSGRIA